MVSTLREAVHELVTFDRIFEPPTATRDYYDEKCGHFGALYDTLRPVSARYQK
jgi:xylulokinase